ncbi:MAG: bifunctional DNA-formamidopyrimidine glycosylase/DNA-(apurinic or apyrimidinic site) lyase [Acidobacteriota bacterium]|nr:bifunctional DNA-formamidopyrimidine glycosylase/DNA-(apurinic or apyrimidinic site) lyase [Acidobacteriota bacterium]
MPELPEVETVRRMLEPALQRAKFRRVILNRPNLRIPFPDRFAERLRGTTVEAVLRRGKYLVVALSSGESLIMHLGMSGWFHVAPIGDRTREADAHDHVVFVMSSGQSVVFNDPRRFGFMDLAPVADDYPSLKAMGPEPLSPTFTAASLARACRGKRIAIKVALLDQRIVGGLGNIYASEALHHARLSPLRKASSIATITGKPRKQAEQLAASIKAVLTNAIRRSESPYRAGRFRVYERTGEPCLRKGCDGTIRQLTQAARSTYYCPVCQR